MTYRQSSGTAGRGFLGRDPLDIIAHEHAMQAELCDALERIADGLPDDIDRKLCARTAATLQFDLPVHHRDEEAGLFPLLRGRALVEDAVDAILDRLQSEHDADADFAGEVAELLSMLGRGERVPNTDMLGYMLRGFFERYRRHVQWENTLVMPLARLRLTADDLSALAALMEENRHQAL